MTEWIQVLLRQYADTAVQYIVTDQCII